MSVCTCVGLSVCVCGGLSVCVGVCACACVFHFQTLRDFHLTESVELLIICMKHTCLDLRQSSHIFAELRDSSDVVSVCILQPARGFLLEALQIVLYVREEQFQPPLEIDEGHLRHVVQLALQIR